MTKNCNFWKELGSVKSVYQEQIEALQKDNQLLTKNGVVYYRTKPKNKRILRTKGVKFTLTDYKLLAIGLTAVLAIIVFAYVYEVKKIDYISPVSGKVNLDPVRFTKEELETFYRKHATQAYAGTPTSDLIIETFGKDAEWALKCLKSENATHGATRTNVNRDGTTDVGVFQINAYWHCGKIGYPRSSTACIEELKKPEVNIKIAKQIFDTQGKSAWYGKTCK